MNKYVIIIFLILGIGAAVFGAWAKVLHKEYAGTAMTVALVFEIIVTLALLAFFVLWFKKPKKNK